MPNNALKQTKAPFPPGWSEAEPPEPNPNAISPNDYLMPRRRQLSKIPRPDCGHDIELEVDYNAGSIDSVQRKELREKIASTPCAECEKERKNAAK